MVATTTSNRRSKSSIVKKEVVGDVADFLQELPDKPKSDLSLKEAVRELQELIRAAFAKGYTHAEVAAMLTDQGIRISAFTLKSYVPAGKRQATRGKTRRPRKTSDASVAGAIAESDHVEPVEAVATTPNGSQPTTSPKRGGAKATPTSTAAKTSTNTAKTTARTTETTARKPTSTTTKRSKKSE